MARLVRILQNTHWIFVFVFFFKSLFIWRHCKSIFFKRKCVGLEYVTDFNDN